MNHILRYHIPEGKAEERIPEIIDYCRRTGCTEVSLFTSSYDNAPSFIELPEVERYADKLVGWAEILRKVGIRVGINVLQTLGHIYFPEELSQKFPFQRRVDIDGKVSRASACPLDKKLQEYQVAAYKAYSQVKPTLVFIDDDFRQITESMFCFCPLHLKRFTRITGREISLPELKAHIINKSFEPDSIRRQYHEMLSDSLLEMAALLRDAVHEISPESRLGFMAGEPPHILWGMDISRLAEVLAQPQGKPFIRPQICVYYEDTFKTVPFHFSSPMITRNLCSPKVEMYPEIENYMYTTFAKSAQFTASQITFCLLNGLDNLMLNIFDMYGSSFSDSREIIDMLEVKKRYFRKLKALVPTGSLCKGIALPVHPQSPLYRRVDASEEDWYGTKKGWLELFDGTQTWYNWLPFLGLPVGYQWDNSPWNFLAGDDVLGMPDTEIDGYFKRGVLLDARAVECLEYRGYAERVGFKSGGKMNIDDIGSEHFRDSALNGGFRDRYHPLRACANVNDYRRIVPFSKDAEVVSEIINYKGEAISPMVAVRENGQKERIGVIAYCGAPDERISIVNNKRQEQMYRVFGWLAKKELPAAVINHPYLVPTYQKTNGRILLGLFNLSSEVVAETTLRLPELENKRFRGGLLDGNGAIRKFEPVRLKKEKEPVYYFLHRILPYETKVFIFEER